jgi:hypothetical protein
MGQRVVAVPRDTDRAVNADAVRQLGLEYVEAIRRSEAAWLYVQQPWDGELQYETFSYVPEYHFRTAYDRLTGEVEPDGGYRDLHSGTTRATVYYWYDPDTGAVLEHTGVNDEQTVPFFPDEETAHDYLEHRTDTVDADRYEGLSLYKARTRKVRDAVDVLTDQSGIDDFAPDGGLQIDDPKRDQVWFWYNPSLDSIVQEEVEPYDVRGVFGSADDAERFLDWYADQYGVADTSHLELYRAELTLEGFGRKHLDGESERSEEPPEQVDFAAFQPENNGGTGDRDG